MPSFVFALLFQLSINVSIGFLMMFCISQGDSLDGISCLQNVWIVSYFQLKDHNARQLSKFQYCAIKPLALYCCIYTYTVFLSAQQCNM